MRRHKLRQCKHCRHGTRVNSLHSNGCQWNNDRCSTSERECSSLSRRFGPVILLPTLEIVDMISSLGIMVHQFRFDVRNEGCFSFFAQINVTWVLSHWGNQSIFEYPVSTSR